MPSLLKYAAITWGHLPSSVTTTTIFYSQDSPSVIAKSAKPEELWNTLDVDEFTRKVFARETVIAWLFARRDQLHESIWVRIGYSS
jgi:hypothetical protein